MEFSQEELVKRHLCVTPVDEHSCIVESTLQEDFFNMGVLVVDEGLDIAKLPAAEKVLSYGGYVSMGIYKEDNDADTLDNVKEIIDTYANRTPIRTLEEIDEKYRPTRTLDDEGNITPFRAIGMDLTFDWLPEGSIERVGSFGSLYFQCYSELTKRPEKTLIGFYKFKTTRGIDTIRITANVRKLGIDWDQTQQLIQYFYGEFKRHPEWEKLMMDCKQNMTFGDI